MKRFLIKAWISLCGMAVVAVAPDALATLPTTPETAAVATLHPEIFR